MDEAAILKTEYSYRFDEYRYQLMGKEKVSPQFDDLRQKMMIMSFYKYGAMKDNYDKHKCMDALGNIRKRCEKYIETKNVEFLADIANFAMIEFMYPSIPGAKREFHKIASPLIDNVSEAIETCLKQYQKEKDCMYLVILANYSALEFSSPMLKGAHYVPTDSGACDVAGFGIKQLQDEMEEKENQHFQRFI